MHRVLFITCMHTCNYGHKHSHTHTHTYVYIRMCKHTHRPMGPIFSPEMISSKWINSRPSLRSRNRSSTFSPLYIMHNKLIMFQSTLLLHYAVNKLGQEPQCLIKLPVSTAVRFLWQRFSQLRTALHLLCKALFRGTLKWRLTYEDHTLCCLWMLSFNKASPLHLLI